MNEFPIVTSSELVVSCFFKMPIKVRTKPLLNTICVLPFLVLALQPIQVLAQPQQVETKAEQSSMDTKKVDVQKEAPKQVTSNTPPPTSSPPSSPTQIHSTTRKSSDHLERAEHKTSHPKNHTEDHSSKGKQPQIPTKGSSTAEISNRTTHSTPNTTTVNSSGSGLGLSAPALTQGVAPMNGGSLPGPTSGQVAVPGPNQSTSSPPDSTGSTSSFGKSATPSPFNTGTSIDTGSVQNPNTSSNISSNTSANNSSGANPTNPSSVPSWIGSFVDSLLNFPLLNPKSSSPNNGRNDMNTNGVGTINLGPLPEPTPTPLYLNASKHSTPLSTPYPLSSGERNTTGDNAVLDMAQAFKRGDRKRLTSTLPYAIGHPLEPWAAYWELRARLDEANYSEVRDFLKRYAGTYQEDRLRNDWLLMVGSRREWDTLLDEYPYFRMRDDKELQCYYLLAQFVQLGPKAQADTSELVLQNWHALRDADDGCMLAVDRLFDAHKISDLDVWRKVRAATEYNQGRLAKNALKIIEPKLLPDLEEIFKNPSRFLSQPSAGPGRPKDELITLALIRLSASDHADAIRQLQSRWSALLSSEQRTWVWAAAGREAALKGDSKSLDYFEHAVVDKEIANDELLAWKVRVALRVDSRPRWEMVEQAIGAMSATAQKDPAWTYWRARALLQKKPQTQQITQEAQALLNSIAGVKGFYEQLALEELGKKITSPARPEPLKAQELAAVKANPALRRALYAINLGLRSEGNREWNYATNLVDNAGRFGGMSDKDLLAAASYACELEIWDRCVNAAERAKVVDATLRFPMPFKEMVLKRTKEISLDPAYVYGLIRQESRFVMDAKSTVGASGLMQVMPKTAAWTAKKIGMLNFRPELLATREVNIAIGTGYLKLVLDSFEGSMPMAAAAYNAGPSRVRHWQEGSVVEGAIWAEFLPFNETRDYVKKVISNTVNYQALITSEPQSIKSRLGVVGPMELSKTLLENPDLP